ncbi:MAG: tryptophan synthase subunit alpha [Thermoflexus sp.]|uniref:tryptophan synthase subunit alpha n=1 Tax=Thermoflexus sp. TaxID=1969742 RepID=UPI003324EA7B
MRGKEAVRGAFQQARAEGRAALVLYWPLGYPDLETSIAVVVALAQAGADALELGVPFSDPLADGPTIQRATHRALQHGVRTPAVLEAVARIRGAGVRQALCLMTYVNPVLAWGLSAFMEAARRAGGDGVILPDVPLEESAPFRAAAEAAGLAWVPLAAPTTPDPRLRALAATATGFLYLVSVTGITGVRERLPEEVVDHLRRARGAAEGVPVAVGFGISRPEQVAALAREADGVVIGSALIQHGEACGFDREALQAFVADLRRAAVRTGAPPRCAVPSWEGDPET